MAQLSIVIPCYNEAENIPLILAEYGKLIQNDEIELVLVNNGSTDNTAQVLDWIRDSYPFLKILTIEVNQGYGFGILAGLRSAESEYLGWTHGDMQTPPQDILTGWKIIKSRPGQTNIYLKGTRYGRPFFDKLITWGMTAFETVYFGLRLNDINAQPSLFHRSFFAKWKNPPIDFSLDLYVLYQARKEKMEVIRFPVAFLKRLHGQSNWNKNLLSKFKAIKKALAYSIRLKKDNC